MGKDGSLDNVPVAFSDSLEADWWNGRQTPKRFIYTEDTEEGFPQADLEAYVAIEACWKLQASDTATKADCLRQHCVDAALYNQPGDQHCVFNYEDKNCDDEMPSGHGDERKFTFGDMCPKRCSKCGGASASRVQMPP